MKGSFTQSHSDGGPSGIPGKHLNVFSIRYIQTFAMYPTRTATSRGTTGMEKMQECSPLLPWCEQRSTPLKSPPRALPTSQDISRLLLGNFSKHISTQRRAEKKHIYIEKTEKYPNAPRRMFDPWHAILMGWISKIKATLEGYYDFYRTTTKMGRKKARGKKAKELPWGATSQGRYVVAKIQESCLILVSFLVSGPTGWSTIIADRISDVAKDGRWEERKRNLLSGVPSEAPNKLNPRREPGLSPRVSSNACLPSPFLPTF